MGCNTSKEVATVDDNKPDIKENGDALEENHVNDSAEDKAASAKTITLKSASRPNSSATSVKAEAGSVHEPEEAAAPEHQEGTDPDEEKAATKIQAVFRGHKSRKSMKQSDKPTTPEQEPTQAELEAEFRADDEELCHAATKIQASFRGHMSRKVKEGEGKDDEPNNANTNTEEELDIDLADPELSKAAVKIQASFRGHMARKDNEGAK